MPVPPDPAAPIEWASAARRADFENWLGPLLPRWGLQPASLAPASADASFRRYFRIQGAACSWIIMDAPPPLEDVRPFVDVAARLLAAGLHAPRVHACDAERGFLLLDDLGTESYLDAFARRPADAGALMGGALAALVRLQSQVDPRGLPPFDEALLVRELELFPDWCVGREFGIEWSALERAAWSAVCRALLDSALAQATVPVHRDWMPRNLMVGQPDPGVLDFQDAVVGPLTYDIACLLRDAFVSWEEPQEIDWAVRWWQAARAAGLPVGDDFGEVWRALEWMGLQRHLKVMGIFARLKHRDGKPRYVQDLPRFLNYATRVSLRYRPLKPLLALLEPLSGRRLAAGYTF